MNEQPAEDPRIGELRQTLDCSAVKPFSITSPLDKGYNCVAWTLGDKTMNWWPIDTGGYFWPAPDRNPSLRGFMNVYADLGYGRCTHESHESAVEVVAIYVDEDGVPTHAAKKLSNGNWSSKLGDLEDVEHTEVDAVSGRRYGEVAVFLCRAPVAPLGSD